MKSLIRKILLNFLGWVMSDKKAGIKVGLFVVNDRFITTIQSGNELSVLSVFPDGEHGRLTVSLNSTVDVEVVNSGSFSAYCKQFFLSSRDDSMIKIRGKLSLGAKEFHVNHPAIKDVDTHKGFLKNISKLKPLEPSKKDEHAGNCKTG